MMENLIIGPVVILNDSANIQHECNRLLDENWLPLYLTKSGGTFESVKATLSEDYQKQLTGVIISVGFYKLYES
jgi:hypothetical protein